MATNPNSAREERRRKIMERGNNRMALITGQVKALDSSPSFPSSSSSSSSSSSHHQIHKHTDSSPPVILSHYDHTDPFPAGDEIADIGSSSDISNANITGIPNELEPLLDKFMTSSETIRTPVLAKMNKLQSARLTPYQSPYLFSSKRINSCVIASEKVRATSALIIASLALMSSMVGLESVLAFKPLYLVLLTDVTIVVALVFRERIKGFHEPEEPAEEKMASTDDGQNWVGAVRVLERGLAAYQALRGFFIDSSIYLVVVICGTSLV